MKDEVVAHYAALSSGRQDAFDVLAVRLQESRQLQVFAERIHGLINGEAGNIGGDLEQDAAGFTEVDRTEVVAILLLGRMLTMGLHQLARHFGLVGIIDGAEGDVVHRAGALASGQEALGLIDVDDAAGRIVRFRSG